MKAPNGLTAPVARASVPSNMSNAPPMKTTSPPRTQTCAASKAAPTTEIPKPMSVSPLGVRPARPIARAIGSKTFLIRPRDSLEIVTGSLSAREPEDRALTLGEFLERFFTKSTDGPAPLPPRDDAPGGREPAEMPRHERLREADMGDELRDGRLALG